MPLGGLGPWGWRASFARLSPKPGKHRAAADPPPRGLARSGGALPGDRGAGCTRRRRRRLQGSTRGSLGRPPPGGAGTSLLPILPPGPRQRFRAAARRVEGRHPGAAGERRGAAPWRSGGLWAPCSAASEEARGLPAAAAPHALRSASLGEAAARRPPRAGSSPARFGGPRSTPGGRPRAPPALRERRPGLLGPLDEGEPNFGLITRES